MLFISLPGGLVVTGNAYAFVVVIVEVVDVVFLVVVVVVIEPVVHVL